MILLHHRYGKPVPGSASDIRGQKYQKAVNDEVENIFEEKTQFHADVSDVGYYVIGGGGKKEGDKKMGGVDSLEIAIFPTEVDSGVAICQDVLVRGRIFHNIFHNLQYLTLHDYA